jgi:type II secretory pathway pseudopilin PulG
MAALLVALAVMAVLMSVALPVWRQQAQREKEEELVFRGNQYVRAIRLFQSKSQTFPTSVDMLVQGHFLRKKYKDPITNEDFDYIPAAGMAGQPGQQGGPGAVGGQGAGRGPITAGGQGGGRGPIPSSGVSSPTSMGSQPGGAAVGAAAGGMIPGGMLGVRSKSKDESIRLYLGRNHYNEWMFTYVGQQPGGAGGRGQPGGGPGGRGRGNDGRGTVPPVPRPPIRPIK